MTDKLSDMDPNLLSNLTELGKTYGPLGVAIAAALLSDPEAVRRRLPDPEVRFRQELSDLMEKHRVPPKAYDEAIKAIKRAELGE